MYLGLYPFVAFKPSQGGTLVKYDGKVRLLELAQVPKDKVRYHTYKNTYTALIFCFQVDEFKSVSKFK